MPKWKKITSKRVYACPRFDVFEDKVILPDGSRGVYYYRKSRPGVVVIPFDGKKFILVNQYRYIVGKRLWEFPIGRAENNNFLQQAKKELKEETGVSAKNWQYLGSFFPTPGSGNAIGKIFLARNLSFGKHNREAGESDMYMKSFTLKEIENMIVKGRVVDSWTISALYFLKLKNSTILRKF